MDAQADPRTDFETAGLFDAGHTAFLETITHLRPALHRYCARMTNSVLDGEDVMQEALFEAYRKLAMHDQSIALSHWLFRIAHNRCIDFLRRRRVRQQAETAVIPSDVVLPIEPPGGGVSRAVERLVYHLPPKERACVLLKDVFDYSLDEIADLVGSTSGGVKSALSRGRAKLQALPQMPAAGSTPNAEAMELLRLYVDRFNRRDWDGVRELASADAKLRVADCFSGRLADSPYFVEYERPIIPWRMALGSIDGEIVVIILRADLAEQTPFSVIRLTMTHDKISGITDYIKSSWILDAAERITIAET